jgi:choline dehydrogenase-like flavoprotein
MVPEGGRRFDTAVLGGGTAGCVVAARLSEDSDRRVCLVEGGPDYGPASEGRWPSDLTATFKLPSSHDWSDGERSLPVARVIGGCSAHNAALLVRGSRGDYDEWGEGWTAADMEPHLERALAAVRARPCAEAEAGPWGRVIREAALQAGVPLLDDLDADGAIEGVGHSKVNIVSGERWNAAFAYLDDARGRASLEVMADALVDRIELDGGRATAAVVHAGGRRLRLEADRFVISAGALGSPAVLMRSGIGPAAHLREHSIRVVVDLPVGEGLQDHAGFAIEFRPGAAFRAELDDFAHSEPAHPVGAVRKLRSPWCEPGTWDGHSVAWTGMDDNGEPWVSLSSFAMKPRSRGRVRLRSADPSALPLVENRLCSDEEGRDLGVVLDGILRARELAATDAVAAAVEGERDATAAIQDDAGWRAYAQDALASYYHPTSTCARGQVVDADGRVLGIDNLHVVDASIMPSIPRSNTNLSVLALAELVCARLR